ncbi:hypothetical protein BaRGS_00021086 [Batillaria attramentaria]|uniref:Uncharacterized protein n=1 Tax=Batillaria attramentaria TaxID=370345 RepID=A0ABD0KKP5_9CAEN
MTAREAVPLNTGCTVRHFPPDSGDHRPSLGVYRLGRPDVGDDAVFEDSASPSERVIGGKMASGDRVIGHGGATSR